MCKIVKIIAQRDDFRNITQCEHGTVHLNWYRASLHIPPQEFTKLVSFLETAVNEDRDILRDETGMVERDRRSNYHLWLMGMGLYLDAADFLILVDLLRQSVTKLTNPQPEKLKFILQPRCAPRQLDMPKQSGTLFSEN
ncbi:MAG: hypothetical protein HF973_06140 [Chloroflexi bacterium]|nr:hypothetical protein [Chloroflexota bacterium]